MTRIYIPGSHSTGKTTLARWISATYNLPMVNEVARAVLAERELDFVTLRTNLAAVTSYQEEVFRRQAGAEEKAGQSFVSDRAFDSLAYTASHTMIVSKLSAAAADYAERLRRPESIVLFLRPHRELLTEDGTRESPVWDEVVRIDAMVKMLLEWHDVEYVCIASLSMQERARTVRAVLKAAGVEIGRKKLPWPVGMDMKPLDSGVGVATIGRGYRGGV